MLTRPLDIDDLHQALVNLIVNQNLSSLLLDSSSHQVVPLTEEEILNDLDNSANLNLFSAANLKLLKHANKALVQVYQFYFTAEMDKQVQMGQLSSARALQRFVRDFNVEKLALFQGDGFNKIWKQANSRKLRERLLSHCK